MRTISSTLRQVGARLKLLFALLLLVAGTGAHAHEILPAIVDLNFEKSGFYTLSLEVNLEALIAKIGPEHADTDASDNANTYNDLRALTSAGLRNAFLSFEPEFLAGLALQADGTALTPTVLGVDVPVIGDLDLARLSIIRLEGALPSGAQDFVWGWEEAFGASVIRLKETPQNDAYSAYLVAGQTSEPLAILGVEARSFWTVVADYVAIGYSHIVPKGLDHILFVVGLFLLSTRLHPLLWQITAFTVAHTVTLALGVLGVISIPANIVEPLIALSIVYVAVENIFVSHLSRWRPVIVFGFGLLHGLGFAGVLREIGLGSNQFITGLLSFNIGVELGQLSVIAACFLLVGFWFQNKSWYRTVITIPASLVIAVIASWWFVERTFLA